MSETEESWYSDEALAKQTALTALPEGAKPDFTMLYGIWEPRVKPTEAERCCCCGGDGRDEDGGRTRPDGKAFCSICVGRGHDEDEE